MKTIQVPTESRELNDLLEQARQEDVIVRAPDGSEFMLVAVEDDFDEEIARTRANEKLMSLLDERMRGTKERIPLAEVKRRLGL